MWDPVALSTLPWAGPAIWVSKNPISDYLLIDRYLSAQGPALSAYYILNSSVLEDVVASYEKRVRNSLIKFRVNAITINSKRIFSFLSIEEVHIFSFLFY